MNVSPPMASCLTRKAEASEWIERERVGVVTDDLNLHKQKVHPI